VDRPESVIPVLTGPTAVGKTALSLDFAERIGAEIVSVDSRQIYRGMDIGTAKPSQAELQRVRHHMIDEREPDDPISAGGFAKCVWARIDDVHARGKSVVLAGGSTLYLRAITEGIADIPSIPPETRTELNDRLQAEGSAALFHELEAIDPDAAKTMDPSKSQRIVRALEVYHATGRRLSDFHAAHRSPPFSFRVFVLDRSREELYERINARVGAMIADGLVDETIGLLERYGIEATPLKTIGYREIIEHLDGRHSLDRAVDLIKRNTRRYAKRQLTWLRGQDGYQWMSAADTTIQDLGSAAG
jgi:tRNA dimethylallyltransferase